MDNPESQLPPCIDKQPYKKSPIPPDTSLEDRESQLPCICGEFGIDPECHAAQHDFMQAQGEGVLPPRKSNEFRANSPQNTKEDSTCEYPNCSEAAPYRIGIDSTAVCEDHKRWSDDGLFLEPELPPCLDCGQPVKPGANRCSDKRGVWHMVCLHEILEKCCDFAMGYQDAPNSKPIGNTLRNENNCNALRDHYTEPTALRSPFPGWMRNLQASNGWLGMTTGRVLRAAGIVERYEKWKRAERG